MVTASQEPVKERGKPLVLGAFGVVKKGTRTPGPGKLSALSRKDLGRSHSGELSQTTKELGVGQEANMTATGFPEFDTH